MMKKIIIWILFACLFVGCESTQKEQKPKENKKVVYQVFTRLFGNTNTTNKPWGTIEENGVGKFADFTEKALTEIKDLGVTHIWYTGVLHHAVIYDYTKYGISNDDPDVVKGRAGSPYAVKDYYNVNPDLAVDPSKRLAEFDSLIQRTHKVGLKVIIDIIPNHVARGYEGISNPAGVVDFGAEDDTTVEYHKNNNFYYVVGKDFQVPVSENNYKPLGGEENPLVDGKFYESPAKWTGNGSRLAQPRFNDWYETVKINYGVRPDGTKDFAELPKDFESKSYTEHLAFWEKNEIPNSWGKFKDITSFWLNRGVDGFRFDMAEMVPVEFWSYLNSSIKTKNPDAFILAEVYNPSLYRDYIHLGKMDYLYDKVALYDTIKNIVKGHGLTDNISKIQEDLSDIEHNMLHFLENHDEQRFASPDFGGSSKKVKPAMVVSATISTSPTMIYFGQEVGESGVLNSGFGTESRTTIFDYAGVPSFQRWVNDKKFDGGQLSVEEKKLRLFYKRLLNFTISSTALMGEYREIHTYNRTITEKYTNKIYSYVRWSDDEKLLVVANFSDDKYEQLNFKIPKAVLDEMKISKGLYELENQIEDEDLGELNVADGSGDIHLNMLPFEAKVFRLRGQFDSRK
jgi:glycosidase